MKTWIWIAVVFSVFNAGHDAASKNMSGFLGWVAAFCFSLALALSPSDACAGQVWYLVDSQFSGREWYCTYQLAGSDIQTTITSYSPCAPSIYR